MTGYFCTSIKSSHEKKLSNESGYNYKDYGIYLTLSRSMFSHISESKWHKNKNVKGWFPNKLNFRKYWSNNFAEFGYYSFCRKKEKPFDFKAFKQIM